MGIASVIHQTAIRTVTASTRRAEPSIPDRKGAQKRPNARQKRPVVKAPRSVLFRGREPSVSFAEKRRATAAARATIPPQNSSSCDSRISHGASRTMANPPGPATSPVARLPDVPPCGAPTARGYSPSSPGWKSGASEGAGLCVESRWLLRLTGQSILVSLKTDFGNSLRLPA